MPRITRKDANRPRAKPTSKKLPVTLPFPDVSKAEPPEPIMRFHGYYIVNGVPVHLVGERWRAEDAEHSLSPVTPDPFNAEIVLTSRMESELKGVIIRPVSFEEYRDQVAAFGGPQRSKIR